MAFDRLPPKFRIDRWLGAVYLKQPATADDLTLIHGIGRREAVALNRLGVYFLAQIAQWHDRHIAAFAAEMGMSPSAICQEQWVEQALEIISMPVASPTLASPLPAPGPRTAAVLIGALLIGCLTVYWLNHQSAQPMPGVLAADISSVRVPENSRLLATHVSSGDEVFSGQTLLTVEKLEHLETIGLQKHRVHELQEKLRRTKALVSLDLEWRTRELERELSEVRSRAEFIQELAPRTRNKPRESGETAQDNRIRPVSRGRSVARRGHRGVNALLFISGHSDLSTLETRTALIPRHTYSDVVPLFGARSDDRIRMEARNLELRLARLEKQKAALPNQVRVAAGLESLKLQYSDASRRLEQMKTLSQEVAVLCPAYGTVGQIHYREGDRMSEGEVMLRILHTDRRYVIVHAPTRRLTELQPGTEVGLHFPGDEGHTGLVTNIPMLADSRAGNGESLVSVRVDPVGRHWPELPVGSRIHIVPR